MIFKSFPKPATPWEMRNFLLADETIVIHDKVGAVSFWRHSGPLSIKTVMSGEERYNVHGFSELVRPGEYLVVNGAQSYESSIEAPRTESLSVFFSLADVRDVRQLMLAGETLLDDPARFAPVVEFSATKQDLSSALGARLQAMSVLRDASRLEQNEASVRLLHALLRDHLVQLDEAGCLGSARPAARSELFRRCQIGDAFLRANFTDDISLSAVAAAAGLSRAHFLRAFAHFFGETPAKLVQRLRLERAMEMLSRGECDVTGAAAAVGYANLSAFSRAFRTQFGTRPSAAMPK